MYLSYYGLARPPFEIGPEPEPFFETPAHLDALWGLIYGITENRGFISITGASGVGKTTTLYAAVQSLGLTHPSLLWIEFPDPLISPETLLATIVDRLNLPAALTPGGDLGPIRNRLLRLRETSKSLVMVFDAAQALTSELLAFLERLADLDEQGSPLILMVFIGLPSWDAALRRPEYRGLDRRVAVRVTIPPLSPRLARDYISFRIAAAGGSVAEVMSNGALRALIGFSDGIPGHIHALADHALELGLADRQQPIGAREIRAARSALKSELPSQPPRWRSVSGRTIALGLVVLLFGAVGLLAAARHYDARLTSRPAAPPTPTSTAATPTGGTPATVSATVAPGETMQMLLRRYGLPETPDEAERVEALNPGLGPNDAIHPGQILRLPVAPASGSP